MSGRPRTLRRFSEAGITPGKHPTAIRAAGPKERTVSYTSLRAHEYAVSAALTVGLIWVACAVFTALFPATAAALVGSIFHVVDVKDHIQVTLVGAVVGLVQAVAYAYAAVYLFAWVHGRTAARGVA